MASMKKHSFIQMDFHSSVKLSKQDQAKITLWLGMASQVMEKLIREKKLIHPSWFTGVKTIRVSVLLCGEAKIRQLNSQYRGKNKVTDVLSFPTFENLRMRQPKMDFQSPEVFLGDMAICQQKILKQSKAFAISYWDEFIHLFFHGMIHLAGYDHEISLKEEKIMLTWEDLALSSFSKIKKKGA